MLLVAVRRKECKPENALGLRKFVHDCTACDKIQKGLVTL